MKRLKLGGFILGILVACGCSNREPIVSGIVRLDGELLDKGSITFEPEPGTHAPGGGASIKGGKYFIDRGLAVGKFRVQIRATRKTGRLVRSPIPPDLIEEEVPAVPPEFNTNSTLIRDVVAGPNTLDFDVTGPK